MGSDAASEELAGLPKCTALIGLSKYSLNMA